MVFLVVLVFLFCALRTWVRGLRQRHPLIDTLQGFGIQVFGFRFQSHLSRFCRGGQSSIQKALESVTRAFVGFKDLGFGVQGFRFKRFRASGLPLRTGYRDFWRFAGFSSLHRSAFKDFQNLSGLDLFVLVVGLGIASSGFGL